MIHDKAIVSDAATVADDAQIGPYAVIDADVEIGPGCVIGPHTVIRGPTRMGADNHIYQFASIGDDPQDKKYGGEKTSLVIGNGNTIREFCTINRGTAEDRGETTIGDDNWIMAYSHIAHDCVIGSHTILANCATLAGHVTVGDYAIFGGFSGVHQFCTIGAHSFMGMFSSINRDVPAYVMVSGQPAQPRGINSEGLKRRGFTTEQIRAIKDAYKTLYRSGLKLADACEKIEVDAKDKPELQVLVDSLRASERSIVR